MRSGECVPDRGSEDNWCLLYRKFREDSNGGEMETLYVASDTEMIPGRKM